MKGPLALSVAVRRPRKPSSRWAHGRSCTNTQSGPTKLGRSVPNILFTQYLRFTPLKHAALPESSGLHGFSF